MGACAFSGPKKKQGRLPTAAPASATSDYGFAALHTGFRASEVLSMTWADVAFRRRVMTVRAAYAKNDESRGVPMNEVLTATLHAVRMSMLADGPVFRTRTGKLCRSFRTAFTHAVRQAGMMDFTFHDLRHTFASRLVMSGVDLPTVQALRGTRTAA